jgi:hypothetical protein
MTAASFCLAAATARFMAMVVLPPPPFWPNANYRKLLGHVIMQICGFVKMFKCPHVRIIASLSRKLGQSGSAIGAVRQDHE